MIKKALLLAATMGLMLGISLTAQAATYSSYWVEENGAWKVKDPSGNVIANAWLCDDAVLENGKDVWYLLDANGNMITAGLVQDGTGNFYSLETDHNGYYGMLRYQSGNYDGIDLMLDADHNGSFAAVLNQDGLSALKEKYGVTAVSIDNNNIVYTGNFATQSSTQQSIPDGECNYMIMYVSTNGNSLAMDAGTGPKGTKITAERKQFAGYRISDDAVTEYTLTEPVNIWYIAYVPTNDSDPEPVITYNYTYVLNEDTDNDPALRNGMDDMKVVCALRGELGVTREDLNEKEKVVYDVVEDFINKDSIQGASEYEKAKTALEFVHKYASYKLQEPETISPYSVFGLKEAQCEGYARAYKVVMNALGMDCYFITNHIANHAFNEVCIDGDWYNADPTNSIVFSCDETFAFSNRKDTESPACTATKYDVVYNARNSRK